MLDVALLSWKRSPSNSVRLFMLLEVIAMLGCVTVVLRLRALAEDCWNFSCVFKDILSETAGSDLTYHQWSVGDTALLGHCGA